MLFAWIAAVGLAFVFIAPAAALIGAAKTWPLALAAVVLSIASFWFLLPTFEKCLPEGYVVDSVCGFFMAFVEQVAFPIAPVCWAALGVIALVKAIWLSRQ